MIIKPTVIKMASWLTLPWQWIAVQSRGELVAFVVRPQQVQFADFADFADVVLAS